VMSNFIFIFFFFQAEDGIRDRNVTGVQTCALPILIISSPSTGIRFFSGIGTFITKSLAFVYTVTPIMFNAFSSDSLISSLDFVRSEERRVGKECRCRWVMV